jgi:hypothetical protein
MDDTARLRLRARRAYELGRARAASRVAIVIVPLVGVCGRETGAFAACAVLGGLLLALAVTLRWWRRHGADAVRSGLETGIVPMAAALLLCRMPFCPPHVAVGICTIAGFVAGAVAGHSLTRTMARPWWHWPAVAAIACLTAALGCLGLGAGTAAGASLGIVAGTGILDRNRRGAFQKG